MRDLQQAIKEGGFTPRSPENQIIADQARTIEGMQLELRLLNTKYTRLESMHDEQYTELHDTHQALRKAHQEMQQWEDETCLEIDELDSIIDGQQEYIKQMTAARDYFIKQCDARDMQIKGLVDELAQHKRQLHNTLERKLQMSFELSAAQQEIAALKHSHSDACEMNRRLCLGVEQAEKDAEAKAIQRWGDVDRANFALRQQAAAARAQADNATQDAINCRRTNDSLLDQLQAANAKLECFRIKFPSVYADMEQYLTYTGTSAPTPQNGETVPPRPMWSHYRRE
jgi:chromosome segregation ATPase